MAGGYPDLVKPELPNSVANKAPELFLEGMRTGLAAAANFAQMKRQSESEMARLALQERMAQESHELDKRKLDMAAEMLPFQQRLSSSQADLMEARAQAYADGTATTAQRTIKFNQQMEGLLNDFNEQADKRKLTDPQFAAKNPVDFAMAVRNQKDEFEMANWMPQIRNALKQFQTIADQQKITYGSDKKPKPIWQIINNLQSDDENVKTQTIDDLKSAGHFKERKVPGKATESWGRPIDSLWDKFIGPTETTEEVPDETVKTLQEKSRTFQRVPSRVPPTMLPKSYSAGTQPTELLEPDLPIDGTSPDASAVPASSATPQFEMTETDRILQNALKALKLGARPKAIAERLQGMGIDPSQLWSS